MISFVIHFCIGVYRGSCELPGAGRRTLVFLATINILQSALHHNWASWNNGENQDRAQEIVSFNFNFKVVLAFLSSTEYLNSWSFVKRFIMEEDYTADIGDIIDSVVDIPFFTDLEIASGLQNILLYFYKFVVFRAK